jgi:hypothetical protein
MAPVIHGLIDPKKKEVILQRIRERKAPLFMERKPSPEGPMGKVKPSKTVRKNSRKILRRKFPCTHEQGDLDLSLIIVAKGGRDSDVENLIRRGANPNAKGVEGKTPLHHAVENGHFGSVKLLIAAGASVNVKDDNGVRPLTYAIGDKWPAGNKMLIKFLKRHGATE